MSEQNFSVLIRYREKGGILKFEILRGTKAKIEDTLLEYLSSKDAHSLMILGQSSIDQELRESVEEYKNLLEGLIKDNTNLLNSNQTLLNENQDLLEANQILIESNQTDLGYIEHTIVHRPRPYPYDVTNNITINDGGAPNVFGAYTQVIPQNIYDFGDENNRIKIIDICICDMSANGSYLLEFYKFVDGVYIVLGAVRVTRVAIFSRSFFIRIPCRPLSNDESALYCRLKTSAGGLNMSFIIHVARFVPVAGNHIPISTGVFPFG